MEQTRVAIGSSACDGLLHYMTDFSSQIRASMARLLLIPHRETWQQVLLPVRSWPPSAGSTKGVRQITASKEELARPRDSRWVLARE
jgi:hypothetical protein